MPRFAILIHDHPFLHWDLLLEHAQSLRTWRLLANPEGFITQTTDSITAEPLGDHRLHYLDYEGPVSGDRGTVLQWDAGVFETLEQSETCWRVRLEGRRLTGVLTLLPTGRTTGVNVQFSAE